MAHAPLQSVVPSPGGGDVALLLTPSVRLSRHVASRQPAARHRLQRHRRPVVRRPQVALALPQRRALQRRVDTPLRVRRRRPRPVRRQRQVILRSRVPDAHAVVHPGAAPEAITTAAAAAMLAAAHEGPPSTAAELELQRVEQGGQGEPATTTEEEGARLVDGASSSGEPRGEDLRRVRFADEGWGGAAVPGWWALRSSSHRRRLIAFVLLSGVGYLVVAMVMLVSYRRRHACVSPNPSTSTLEKTPLRVWALVRVALQ